MIETYEGPGLDHFLETYRQERRRLHRERPDLYLSAPLVVRGNLGTTTFPAANTEEGIEKFCAAIRAGTFNKDGPAVVAACRRLRIRHTYKAIRAFCTVHHGPTCPKLDEDDRPQQPDRAECGTCGRAWCFRCNPTPASLCPWCNGDPDGGDGARVP